MEKRIFAWSYRGQTFVYYVGRYRVSNAHDVAAMPDLARGGCGAKMSDEPADTILPRVEK